MTSEIMLARNLTVSLCSQLQSARQHIHELDRALTRQQVTFARIQAQVHAFSQTDKRGLSIPSAADVKADASCDCKDLNLSELAGLDDVIALRAVVDAQHQKNHRIKFRIEQAVPGANPTQAARPDTGC